jgi:hypothetical protein
MKLLSTEVGETSIELLYADNQNTDDASKLLIVRLPRQAEHNKSLAYNRYWALSDLRDFIGEQMEIERKTSEGRA